MFYRTPSLPPLLFLHLQVFETTITKVNKRFPSKRINVESNVSNKVTITILFYHKFNHELKWNEQFEKVTLPVHINRASLTFLSLSVLGCIVVVLVFSVCWLAITT